MSRTDTFVAPRPNRALIRVMTLVNRLFMLKGVPLLRDLWPLNRVPPFRGLANVRHIDLPGADEQRLEAVCGQGSATFITPNHPEFFTDWMIDKELLSRVAPLAASWATHGVVNGLGGLAQKFWLANNLIAQIPGNGAPAREFSESWALRGNGVLLHPEGSVGWHGNYVAPLLPGAVEMALEALEEGRKTDPDFQAWVAPVVWKLVFLHDVERPLAAECAYVERKLKLAIGIGAPLPHRIHRIYQALLDRDAETLGIILDKAGNFAERQAAVIDAYRRSLTAALAPDQLAGSVDDLLRQARRRLRERASMSKDERRALKALADGLARVRRVGPFAFADETVTQEELAEHLKRIRNDYCAGTFRDTLNRFLPQPAGPRRAVIRVPEPIALHGFPGSPEEALALLRQRMQAALDTIEAGLERRRYPNPFFEPQAATAAPTGRR